MRIIIKAQIIPEQRYGDPVRNVANIHKIYAVLQNAGLFDSPISAIVNNISVWGTPG